MNPFTVCFSVALLQGGLAAAAPSAAVRSAWEDFKTLHNKQHAGHKESARMAHFEKTRAEILEHNARYAAGLESFSMKLNKYSDLTNEEFQQVALGFNPHPNDTMIAKAPLAPMGNLPPSVDWRTRGVMTPVRDQGNCGSCYAFASSGVLESYLLRTTGQSYDFSEQAVVDCSFQKFMGGQNNGGCKGGHPSAVFDYWNQRDVIDEYSYPYMDNHGQCMMNSQSRVVAGRLRPKQVMLNNEMELKHYVANYGPIVIGLAADNQFKAFFRNLGDGIFDNDQLGESQPNHVVVLVGYGNERGKEFWIIRNSWGEGWGNGGYGRIIAGKNMANIVASGAWILQ